MSEPTGFGMVPRHLEGKLTALELATYVALSWSANPEGKCWPSHRSLAKSAGCSEPSVKRALKGLREKGWVTWENRVSPEGDPTSNIYYLSVWQRKGSPKGSGKGSGNPSESEGVGSHRPHRGVTGIYKQDHLNETNASTKVVPTDAASRGQRDRRPEIDLDALAAELDDDIDCTGWLAGNWADGADGLVEAAWAELQTKDAINDKGAWLAKALSNQQTAVGKATRLLKIVGDDYDDE